MLFEITSSLAGDRLDLIKERFSRARLTQLKNTISKYKIF